ncbi:MAG TPA: beta-ketoacyl-ACP synthase II [Candidatus Avoscillospira stercorigallinarum]|uniref:3-oxoacyl-[acyl-carrier-protein] synthase 2 n=1 Tax=Candidatus Avoscillospira stercorigallinarum TaxID=2840708 RepID=A0A9D0Z8U2_9FIRM|nr:beta-ketoacyl-ACP synthase II [Candidatus Avoscillospira stercorigallinarum]
MTERRVVVTGMGCVTPLGNDLPTFWSNLVAGKNGIGPITKFDTTDFKAKLAAEVRDFDPKLYMEKPQILHSDLYAQLAMAAAVQAMEDSGLAGTLPGERIGVYVGSGIGGIQTFEAEHAKLLNKGPRRVSAYFIPMMIANIASSMIAIRYGCMGPAMPAVTACASGSNAIGEALRVVRHGYADAMICGGAEATVTPLAAAGFCNMQALSTSEDPNAASLPFDARRGGFVMGEGSGILVLEEYEHAKARGAKIYGEVCGYGSTNDAHHITAPHPEGAGGARAMADALREAGYTGDELVYVNAHGTGTHLNDAIETMALKKAFGEEKAKGLLISSTKSMTGHMLGAAGAVEAIASLKALEEGVVPPTINLLEADPDCDLNYVPGTAVQAPVTLALSNSLGFGGHNACLTFRKL